MAETLWTRRETLTDAARLAGWDHATRNQFLRLDLALQTSVRRAAGALGLTAVLMAINALARAVGHPFFSLIGFDLPELLASHGLIDDQAALGFEALGSAGFALAASLTLRGNPFVLRCALVLYALDAIALINVLTVLQHMAVIAAVWHALRAIRARASLAQFLDPFDAAPSDPLST